MYTRSIFISKKMFCLHSLHVSKPFQCPLTIPAQTVPIRGTPSPSQTTQILNQLQHFQHQITFNTFISLLSALLIPKEFTQHNAVDSTTTIYIHFTFRTNEILLSVPHFGTHYTFILSFMLSVTSISYPSSAESCDHNYIIVYIFIILF